MVFQRLWPLRRTRQSASFVSLPAMFGRKQAARRRSSQRSCRKAANVSKDCCRRSRLAPCFAIRKPAGKILHLKDYVAAEIMTPIVAKVLAEAVAEGRNILVAGGTGSGKTTLANALLAAVAVLEQRVVIIED